MEIKQKLGDYLVANTNFDAKTVGGLQAGTAGPQVIPQVDLAAVADNIAVDGTIVAEHAIPTMFAHIASFQASITKVMDELGAGSLYVGANTVPYLNYVEWKAMLSMIALRHIYRYSGLNLTLKEQQLSSVGNPLEATILLAMRKEPGYQQAYQIDGKGNATGKLFYICQNEIAFAVFHPIIGLCPLQTYDKALFDGVIPWFDANKQHAATVHDCWTENFPQEDFYTGRVAWWASQNVIPSIKALAPVLKPAFVASNWAALNAKIDPLTDDSAFGAAQPNLSATYGGAIAQGFCNAPVAYLAGGKKKGVPNIFTSVLYLAYSKDAVDNRLIYNQRTSTGVIETPLTIAAVTEALCYYTPVPPFTQAGAQMVQDECGISNLMFHPTCAEGNLECVTVAATLQTAMGECFTVEKTYGYQDIRRGQLPYLLVWPYVPMPANVWKRYYLYQGVDATEGMAPTANLRPTMDGAIRAIEAGVDSVHAQNEVQEKSVWRQTTNPAETAWPVRFSDSPFQYVTMQADGAEVGVVFVPCISVKAAVPTNAPLRIAVDFGTTSTVCTVKQAVLNGGKPACLAYFDYTKCITTENHTEGERSALHQRLGQYKGDEAIHQGKMFTVAQLFSDWKNQQDLYMIEGRQLLVDAMVLQEFVSKTGIGLEQQFIFNDLKFGSVADEKINRASTIYLASVYLQAIMYALKNGWKDGSVELYASYPNDITLVSLQQRWFDARMIVNQFIANPAVINAMQTVQFVTEAKATLEFQKDPSLPFAAASNLISVDIGGGTTDISISRINLKPVDDITLSVKYAGRELMIASVIQYYSACLAIAKKTGVDQDAIITKFKNLWCIPEAEVRKGLTNSFKNICKDAPIPSARANLINNPSLQMDVEVLLHGGLQLGNARMTTENNFLRSIISLKFLFIFRIVSQCVAENIDRWVNAKTEKLEADLPITIAFSGTSAQALQYVFNAELPEFEPASSAQGSNLGLALSQLEKMMETCIGQERMNGYAIKLNVYVQPDVSEKKEVAFGMQEFTTAPDAPLVIGATAAEKVARAQVKQERLDNLTMCAKEVVDNQEEIAKYQEFVESMTCFGEQIDAYVAPTMAQNNYDLGNLDYQRVQDLFKENGLRHMDQVRAILAGGADQKHRLLNLCDDNQQAYAQTMMNIYLMDEELNHIFANL